VDPVTKLYRSQFTGSKGLPGECYTSAKVFSEESKRLFHQSWMCIGTLHDAPAKGDLYPVEFAGAPLLIVRGLNLQVRVFHNVCAHRGALLATEPRSCRGSIICPYHNWAYNLDGKLVRMPHSGGAGKHGFSQIDPSKNGLVEVRSANWYGLIFVNISGTAAEFDEFIAPVQKRIGALEPSSLRYDKNLATEMTFEANWKLVVENFVESYHVPSIHPELERVNPMRDHYQILGGHSYLGQGGTGYSAIDEKELSGLPLRNDMSNSCYEVFYIYPNLIFGPVANFNFVIIANPKSAELTHERLEFAFYGDESMSLENEPRRSANAKFLQLVNSQDIEICKLVQAGRHSPGFVGGVFALPQEATSLHFMRMIAARMVVASDESFEDIVSLPTENIYHELASP